MNKTDRVNVSLSPEIRVKAQRLAEATHGGKVSRLLSYLVEREDAKQEDRKKLATLLEEGHNSPIIEVDASEYFNQARAGIAKSAK